MGLSTHPVLFVMAIAVTASLLAEIRLGVNVPAVVWEMLLAILVGPHLLGWVHSGSLLNWLESLGLGALFFMAGLELDLQKVKGRPLNLAILGWSVSLGVGFAAAGLLHILPFVHTPMMVSLALTTTAMGTLMPILRDGGTLHTKFGALLTAACAAGEFGPVVVMSLALTQLFGPWQEVVLMLGFVTLTLLAALVALGPRPPKIVQLLERTMNSSTQLPVLIALLVVAFFDVLSKTIGLEGVLGAFAAGMVIGLATRGENNKPFREKMAAVCFGFLVPFLFVVSGINLDLGAILHNAKIALLVPLFLFLFLLTRGTPVVFYRHDLAKEELWPFALYSATALPMVVAITSLGVRTGRMQTDIAAALVAAALLSVLLFPVIAKVLLSKVAYAVRPQTTWTTTKG